MRKDCSEPNDTFLVSVILTSLLGFITAGVESMSPRLPFSMLSFFSFSAVDTSTCITLFHARYLGIWLQVDSSGMPACQGC